MTSTEHERLTDTISGIASAICDHGDTVEEALKTIVAAIDRLTAAIEELKEELSVRPEPEEP
jgi:predicted RNase H-like HicB family nuclease